jgi:AcrR family transcriptional regulator
MLPARRSEPPRLPKAERTRRQILAAAELVFAERGFEKTRLEDVAAAVGIAPSAILYHFRDKRELYRALLDGVFAGLGQRLAAALRGRAPAPERIEALVKAVAGLVRERPALARIAWREATTDDPALREELRTRARPFLRMLSRVLSEGERSGAIRPIRSDPFHFVSAIAGTLLFYVAALPTFVPDLPYDPLAPEQMERLERDVLSITRRLLGIGGPRPLRARKEAFS